MATKMEVCHLAWFYEEMRRYLPAPEDDSYDRLKKGFHIETGLTAPKFMVLSARYRGLNSIPENWLSEELEQSEENNTEIMFLRWFCMNAPYDCYSDVTQIQSEIMEGFEKKYNVICFSEMIHECKSRLDLGVLNRDLTANRASELEYLRYYHSEADDYMGPASGDIYSDIEEGYCKKTGKPTPEVNAPNTRNKEELDYLLYFYAEAADAYGGAEADVEDSILQKFEAHKGKRAPSYYRSLITYREIEAH